VTDETTEANGMTATPPAHPPASWYPDPEHAGWQRYWDGQAWTEHRAPVLQSEDLKPGLVIVWVTALLSFITFWFTWGTPGDMTTVMFPIGVIPMAICWNLVRKANDDARRRGLELPTAYKAARIVATVLAALACFSSAITTFG
jgi:hypothetical protein